MDPRAPWCRCRPAKGTSACRKYIRIPLAQALQIRKLFALESMHDLRLSPDEQITCSSVTIAHRPDYPRITGRGLFSARAARERIVLRVRQSRRPRGNSGFSCAVRCGSRRAIRAVLYGVTTKRINEQVKRNARRFPEDFIFRLTRAETEALNRSQNATGSQRHRDPRFPPYAFTEHGAIMAATILSSPRAVEMSVFVKQDAGDRVSPERSIADGAARVGYNSFRSE